jgi:putative flippase GtrA
MKRAWLIAGLAVLGGIFGALISMLVPWGAAMVIAFVVPFIISFEVVKKITESGRLDRKHDEV